VNFLLNPSASADEKEIMEDIQRRKTPKSNWQKSAGH
jgi:hypothetical protein